MKLIKITLVTVIAILSCNTKTPTQFSEAVLNEKFTTLEGNTITLKNILKQHQGKSIVIDVWATWCKDCIVGLPKLQKLQSQYPETAFVLLSLDKKQTNWKAGIKKYNISGQHYYIGDDWDTPFGEFIDLNWIPRYLVTDAQGNIKLFKAINANDKNLKKALKN